MRARDLAGETEAPSSVVEELVEETLYYYRISTLGPNLVESDRSTIITQATAPAEVENFPISFQVESSAHPAVLRPRPAHHSPAGTACSRSAAADTAPAHSRSPLERW